MDSIEKYYSNRKEYNYYKKVNEILNNLEFKTIIDVGSSKNPVLENILNTDIIRVALDIVHISNGSPTIQYIQADFYSWDFDRYYDVVLCMQVLEHLKNPKEFAQKLFSLGKTVIISVPYKWRKGLWHEHIQDPVDESLLKEWTQRCPNESYIIEDNRMKRIICVYKP